MAKVEVIQLVCDTVEQIVERQYHRSDQHIQVIHPEEIMEEFSLRCTLWPGATDHGRHHGSVQLACRHH